MKSHRQKRKSTKAAEVEEEPSSPVEPLLQLLPPVRVEGGGERGGSVESGSEEEEEEEERDERHEKLLAAIGVLGKKRKWQRSEAAAAVSEFHLSQGKAGRVSVSELLRGLGDGQGLGVLKRRLAAVQRRTTPLQPPLSTPQAERIRRTAAYHETSKQVSKWIPIVKRNREVEHLSFPLQEERPPLPSLTTRVEAFQPTTELEREVAAVLEGSENVETNDQELTVAERKALLRMSLEEAQERRRELQRTRALMSFYEQKCRRTGKIKSKKFHRIQRRHKEAMAKRQEREGGGAGEENQDVVEKAERIRAKERITLKHSSLAKWARQQLAREHRDPSTQQALTEHHRLKQQLREKVLMEAEDSESESVCSESVHSEEEEEQDTRGGSNPWLSTAGGSGNSRPQPSLGEEPVLLLDTHHSSGFHQERGGTPASVDKVLATTIGDSSAVEEYVPPTDFEPEEYNEPSDEEVEVHSPASKKIIVVEEGKGDGEQAAGRRTKKSTGKGGRKKTKPKSKSSETPEKSKQNKPLKITTGDQASFPSAKDSGSHAGCPSVGKSDGSKQTSSPEVGGAKNRSSSSPEVGGAKNRSGSSPEVGGAKNRSGSSPEVGGAKNSGTSKHIDTSSFMQTEEVGGALGSASEHLLSVCEAFAGDDVVEDFAREKEAEMERSKPKEVDLTLPGWGVWGGEGVRPPRKRVKVVKPAEPEQPRKDASLQHVIISEKRDKKAAKHMVSSLPWPYSTREQFEKSHCTPVGRHWNSEATFHQMITPRVRTAVGAIIEPIRLTEDVQGFMRRTEKRKREKELERKGEKELEKKREKELARKREKELARKGVGKPRKKRKT